MIKALRETPDRDAPKKCSDIGKAGQTNLCCPCRKQFTVTIGTVFAETHIPLNKWLYAIHLMCSAKKGISAPPKRRSTGTSGYGSRSSLTGKRRCFLPPKK